MCIITFDNRRDSTDRISKKILKRCLEKNPHGMGIMHPTTDDDLFTWRTMTDFEGLWSRYCNARNLQLPVALHFRKNTKGESTLENCHPFISHNGLAFMHNGTIHSMGNLPTGVSDTQHFRNEVLQKLPGDFLLSNPLYSMVRQFLSGDRMLFMDSEGCFSIMNESTGVWEFKPDNADKDSRDGVWFSHTRDREYFMTGKEKKQVYGNHTKGGHYWHGNQWNNKSKTTDKIIHKNQNGKKMRRVSSVTDRIHSQISPTYSSSNDLLVFVYGKLCDDTPGLPFIDEWDASYIGKGIAKGIQLWAINDANDAEIGRPGAMFMKSNKFATKGHLLSIRGSMKDVLKTIDECMGIVGKSVEKNGIKYYRTKVDCTFTKAVNPQFDGQTFSAWAYLATPIEELNPLMAPVPMGDWSEWLRRTDVQVSKTTKLLPAPKLAYDDDGSDDVIEIEDDYSDDETWLWTAYDSDTGQHNCLVCDKMDVIPFSGIGLYTGRPHEEEVDMYWCESCNHQFPVQMTKTELEETIDAFDA